MTSGGSSRLATVCRLLNEAGVRYVVVGDFPRVHLLTLAWSVRYADAAPPSRGEAG